MFFFLSFNKCWPTLFLAHFIILEVQLSESSFHILLYLFILLNSILFFTLPWKRWKNGIHDRSCIFDAKPKNFQCTLDLTLSTISFTTHVFFCWIQNYLQLPTAGLCTVILFFFFNVEQNLLCSICQKLFTSLLFLNDYLTTHDICWSFSPFSFPFTWPYFFFSSLFARIFRYPSFSQSTLFPRQVPFGDYLLMFLLTTFFLHKSSQSSVSK